MCVNAIMRTVNEMFFGAFSVFFAGGYVKALEMTKETPGPGAFRSSSISETYDDVECPRREA